MKDIDFDELDKAVNSLMGGVKGVSDRPEAKTLTLTTTLQDGEQPEYDKIQHAAEKIGSETLLGPTEKTAILSGTPDDQVKVLSLSDVPLEPMTLKDVTTSQETTVNPVTTKTEAVTESTPKSVPIKTSSGRFMDVMHPSSDMKTAQTKTTNSTPSLHTVAPVAAPSRPTVTPEVAPAALVDQPEVQPSPSSDDLNIDTLSPETSASIGLVEEINKPSVGEQVEKKAIVPPVVQAAPAVISTPPVEPSQVALGSAEQVEPLTSPFLPDAKVEKRPLGGGATDTSSSDADTDISSLDNPYAIDNSADTQLTPTEADQTALPDELHNDLLAIETNLAEDPTIEETPAPSTTTPVAVSVHTEAENTSEQSTTAANLDPKDETPENGAIFDTTDYHKTVSHPAKHTSEWVWIAVIVGIILVCGAGAAAFYLIGSQ